MNIIVDTCIWTRFLQRTRSVADRAASELGRLIRADTVQMIGAIRQELLSGAHPDERLGKLRDYLRFFPNLPQDEQDDERAADFYNTCRRRGIQGSSTDLLICALSARHRLKIFSVDKDFDFYASCLPIKLHRPH
jgi:predicted nucleic acid-binding protein